MQYSFVSQETWPAAEASGWEPKPRRGCYLWFCLIQYFVSIFLSGIYDQTHISNHGKSFLYFFNYYEDNHCKSFWYFLPRCRPWQTKQTKRAQATSSENCVFQISPLLAKIDTRSKLATFFFNTRLLLCLEILESNVYVTDIWHRVWSIFRFYKIEISLSAKYPAVYFLLPKGFLLSWI